MAAERERTVDAFGGRIQTAYRNEMDRPAEFAEGQRDLGGALLHPVEAFEEVRSDEESEPARVQTDAKRIIRMRGIRRRRSQRAANATAETQGEGVPTPF